jgi:hypothetical protein
VLTVARCASTSPRTLLRWPYGEERGFSRTLYAAPRHWDRQFWQQEDAYPYLAMVLDVFSRKMGSP